MLKVSQRSWRFIPAGAGNTFSNLLISRFHPVYPRWRGEHFSTPAIPLSPVGLSPLARGTRTSRSGNITGTWFIPAGAGNTKNTTSGIPDPTVYPRWRGEHYPAILFTTRAVGLSPLARGTPFFRYTVFNAARFIPAGAGNTPAQWARFLKWAVYPRWRGEHRSNALVLKGVTGLSPLARGTLSHQQMSLRDCRFIPAGAGNTRPSVLVVPPSLVYPRWRGEHIHKRLSIKPARGLSPLARGTPPKTVGKLTDYRFIPAGAGNTHSHSVEKYQVGGLSPLARGTLRVPLRAPEHRRFIPAGAGNTNSWITRKPKRTVYPRWRGEHVDIKGMITASGGLSPLARGTLPSPE